MACSSAILKGICNDCLPSMGGIKKIYLANYKENAFTVTDGKVSAIDSAVTWYDYYIRKNTASFTSTLNKDDANGSSYVSSEISIVFNRMETAKRIEMSALALADLVAIVEDANNVKWAFGVDAPVTCTAGGGETGTAKADRNAYTITLTAEDNTYPLELSDSVKIVPSNTCE